LKGYEKTKTNPLLPGLDGSRPAEVKQKIERRRAVEFPFTENQEKAAVRQPVQ